MNGEKLGVLHSFHRTLDHEYTIRHWNPLTLRVPFNRPQRDSQQQQNWVRSGFSSALHPTKDTNIPSATQRCMFRFSNMIYLGGYSKRKILNRKGSKLCITWQALILDVPSIRPTQRFLSKVSTSVLVNLAYTFRGKLCSLRTLALTPALLKESPSTLPDSWLSHKRLHRS